MRRAWLGMALAACHAAPPAVAPAPPLDEAITISAYDQDDRPQLAVIEDRRWIDVADRTITLDRVDPRAQLASLVVEPVRGPPFTLGACTRATPDARVRCAISAAPGRRLIRVHYVVPGLGYRARHALALAAETAGAAPAATVHVRSTFWFATPAWQRTATLRLFDRVPGGVPGGVPDGVPGGVPGGDATAHEIARGTIALDGGERAIAPAARAVPGRLRWIYAGTAAITDDADETSPREPRWHRASQPEVWLWLELPPGALPPGAIDAAITLDGAPREPRAIAPAAVRHAASGALRLPLWVDPQLTGERARTTEQSRGRMIDHFEITIRSQAAVAREVWFEEDLRPFPRHVVHVGARPTTARDHVALPLTVGGAAVVHDQLAIDYELLP